MCKPKRDTFAGFWRQLYIVLYSISVERVSSKGEETSYSDILKSHVEYFLNCIWILKYICIVFYFGSFYAVGESSRSLLRCLLSTNLVHLHLWHWADNFIQNDLQLSHCIWRHPIHFSLSTTLTHCCPSFHTHTIHFSQDSSTTEYRNVWDWLISAGNLTSNTHKVESGAVKYAGIIIRTTLSFHEYNYMEITK